MKKIYIIICSVVLLTAIFTGCRSTSPTSTVGYIPTWLQGTWDCYQSGLSALKTEKGIVATNSAIYYDSAVLGKVYMYDGTNRTFTRMFTLSNPSSTCFKVTMNIADNTYYRFDYIDENTVKMTEKDGTAGIRVEYDLIKDGSGSER